MPASRWWHGPAAEWDIVSASQDGKRLLLGEARWSKRPFSARDLKREAQQLSSKPEPALAGKYAKADVVRVLFVPELAGAGSGRLGDVWVVSCSQLLG